jgi:hypothetical protein
MIRRIIRLSLLALALRPGLAAALDGVPPFEWFPFGEPMPEYGYALFLNPTGGIGGFYEGGTPERSMKVKDYAMASILGRYTMWKGLESYCAIPYYWGRSPQEYRDSSGRRAGSITGADFGDVALGLRWTVWRGETRTVNLTGACVFPMASNVWTDYPNATFLETFAPDLPDLTLGDGAYKALAAVDVHQAGDDFRLDALAGYIYKFEMRSGEFEYYGDRVKVRLPSPLVFRVLPAYRIGEVLWLEGVAEGFWAARGRVTTNRGAVGIGNRMDSYHNLLEAHGAAWLGAGLKWEASDTVTVALGLAAPVAVHRYYSSWRICASLERRWSK